MSRILGNTGLPGDHRLLRIQATGDAAIGPGHWFRLALPDLELTLPVLDHSPAEGWVAFCAPPQAGSHGRGTACTLVGPRGAPLHPAAGGRRLVLLTDETGLPAVTFAATQLAIHLVLAAVDSDAPAFRLRPSRFLVTGMGPGVIAGVGVLEEAGVASRIAHPEPLPGCREGGLTALVDDWLAGQSARERWDTAVAVVGEAHTVEIIQQQLRGRVGEIHPHPRPGL